MASVRVNMRVDAGLLGWAKVYAKRRDVTLTSVVEAALRGFREACEGGVPGLGRAQGIDAQAASPAGASERPLHAGRHASATGAVTARGASRSPASTRAPAGRTVTPYDRMMRERQERLNRGKAS